MTEIVSKQNKIFSKFQLEDLVCLMQNERFMLLSSPGTRKTAPVCLYIFWVWHDLGGKTIWTMPSSLLDKNRLELLEWSEFNPEDVVIYTGKEDVTNAKVLLMTFARFRLSADKLWKPMLVAVDEPQAGYRTHDSKSVQHLTKYMEKVPRFVCLTGSLICGRLDSAYPMIRLVEPRYYSSHANFLATHSYVDPFSGKITWTNHSRLARILQAHSTSRSFAEVHGKENVVVQLERVPMAKRQAERYRELERDALIELEDRWLDGSVPGIRAIRARQILAQPEAVKLPISWDDEGDPDEWKTYDLTDGEQTGKDERLVLHFDDALRTGTPIVVFGEFVTEVERIAALARKMGLRVGLLHGGISMEKRFEVDKDFREGRLDAIVATTATAGVGLNWQRAQCMIFASIGYRDDAYRQAIYRGLRGKRETPLRVIVLMYEKAKIEDRQLDVIERKSRDDHAVDPKSEPIDFGRGKAACSV